MKDEPPTSASATQEEPPRFDDAGRLVAPRFGDVYFSAEDGLAETRYVFLGGNRLPGRFAAMPPGGVFTIGETGFGTGLNLLAAWRCFEAHAPADARLAFVSVEAFPLDAALMRRAVSAWPELAPLADALLAQWGPLWPGVHRFRLADGRVRLTLLIGDAAESLGRLDASVDAWLLDGFSPSRNPAMWSSEVFGHVARLSAPGATLATFTAAGFVRRGLESVGFEIEKLPGFGRKRDMTAGRWPGTQTVRETPSHAVVIGGSLAGAFTANALAERGVAVTVIERQALVDGELPSLAPRVSVVQPKISDADDLGGQLLREGFAQVERGLITRWRDDPRIAWDACGTFHAVVDDRVERRLRRFVEQFGGTGLCRWVAAEATEGEVGLPLSVGGVVIDRAGVLRPAGLCAALLDHPRITVRDGVSVERLDRLGDGWRVELDGGEAIDASVGVVANALDALRFEQTRGLKLQAVRGQVTLLRSAGQAGRLMRLTRAMFYGGYATPAANGRQTLGASFVPGDTDLAWRDSEHAVVCDQLARVLPDEAERLRLLDGPSGWVGLRTTTSMHRAYARQVQPGLFVSLGHGSYGVASAAQAGEQLAGLITGAPIGSR